MRRLRGEAEIEVEGVALANIRRVLDNVIFWHQEGGRSGRKRNFRSSVRRLCDRENSRLMDLFIPFTFTTICNHEGYMQNEDRKIK